MSYTVTTFYKFLPLEPQQLVDTKAKLEAAAAAGDILGLLLLAPEGVNATLVGEAAALGEYKKYLAELFGLLVYKDSASDFMPFKRFKVSVRAEIVQLDRTDIVPENEPHVAPAAWDELVADANTILIDVRNWYETKLGAFKGAIQPNTSRFSDFPAWVKQAKIPKSQRIGIYCTGGIRCEKAAVALAEQGYTDVQQLDGGILNYLEQRPQQNFAGECFVFDHRVAVDQELKPSSKYGRCPHCGNGGDMVRVCTRCAGEYKTCELCDAKLSAPACSKRCRNELRHT